MRAESKTPTLTEKQAHPLCVSEKAGPQNTNKYGVIKINFTQSSFAYISTQ